MPNDIREPRTDMSPLVATWGAQGSEVPEGLAEAAAMWLAGSLVLALWTGVAMLLTTA